jgi:hypothetical protein
MAMRRVLSILLILCGLVQARATTYDQSKGISFAFEEYNSPTTNISVTLSPPEWLTNGVPGYFWQYPTNPIALPSFYCTWYSGSWMASFPCYGSTVTWTNVNMTGTNFLVYPNTNAFPIIATVPSSFPTDGGLLFEWIGPGNLIQPPGSYLNGPYNDNFSPGPFSDSETFTTSRGNIAVQSVVRYNSVNTIQCSGVNGVDYVVTDPIGGTIELLNTTCLLSTNVSDYIKATYFTTQPPNQVTIPRFIQGSSTSASWRAVYATLGPPFLATQVGVTNTGIQGVVITSSRLDEYGAGGGTANYLQPFTLSRQNLDTNFAGYYVLTAPSQATVTGGGDISFVEWIAGDYGSESFQTSSTNLTIQIGSPASAIAVYGSTTNFPPSITGPQSAVTVLVGSATNISTTVTGTGPITYQWYVGSSPVSGGTNSTLTFPFAQPSQAGSYSLVAANDFGSATSSACVLTVSNPVVLIGSGQYHLKIRH